MWGEGLGFVSGFEAKNAAAITSWDQSLSPFDIVLLLLRGYGIWKNNNILEHID